MLADLKRTTTRGGGGGGRESRGGSGSGMKTSNGGFGGGGRAEDAIDGAREQDAESESEGRAEGDRRRNEGRQQGARDSATARQRDTRETPASKAGEVAHAAGGRRAARGKIERAEGSKDAREVRPWGAAVFRGKVDPPWTLPGHSPSSEWGTDKAQPDCRDALAGGCWQRNCVGEQHVGVLTGEAANQRAAPNRAMPVVE